MLTNEKTIVYLSDYLYTLITMATQLGGKFCAPTGQGMTCTVTAITNRINISTTSTFNNPFHAYQQQF